MQRMRLEQAIREAQRDPTKVLRFWDDPSDPDHVKGLGLRIVLPTA